jgi:hypothetical protein
MRHPMMSFYNFTSLALSLYYTKMYVFQNPVLFQTQINDGSYNSVFI